MWYRGKLARPRGVAGGGRVGNVSARSLRFDETQSAADASAPYLPSDSPSGVPRAESRLERTGSSTHGMGLWGGKKKKLGILIGCLSANLPEIPTVHLIRDEHTKKCE